MAEIVLFHHAQGLTDGVRAFAEALGSAGQIVHVPDLYEGHTFGSLEEGIAHAEQVGFGEVIARGAAAVEELPKGVVYAGMSLGVLPAQMLAQTRASAAGALLLHSCVPASEFGTWPAGVPVQMHLMRDDALIQPPEQDLAAARELAETVDGAELFLYPGDGHLFTDASLPDFDPDAAALLGERVLTFLKGLSL